MPVEITGARRRQGRPLFRLVTMRALRLYNGWLIASPERHASLVLTLPVS